MYHRVEGYDHDLVASCAKVAGVLSKPFEAVIEIDGSQLPVCRKGKWWYGFAIWKAFKLWRDNAEAGCYGYSQY